MINMVFPLGSLESSKKADLHETISYARYGKILSINRTFFFFQVFIGIVLTLIFLINIEELSKLIAQITSYILNRDIKEGLLFEVVRIYIVKDMGRFPSFYETLLLLIISILMLIFMKFFERISKPLKIYLNYFFFILFISSLYFIFFAYSFPYTLDDFSQLYMVVQVGILSFISSLLSVATAPLIVKPIILLYNLIFIFFVLIYSLIFGIVRYSIFLFILKNYSFLWMANLFFNLGPLLDMIYISGFYSFYLSLISIYINKRLRCWRWLF